MRDEFSGSVKEILAKRVAQRCSNPSCRKPTSGPQDDPGKFINIGVAAHIKAASPGGPRFDPLLTPKERSSADNGIWLCQNCAKLIDNDPAHYTIVTILEWKEKAKKAAAIALEGITRPAKDLIDDADLARIKVLSKTLLDAGKLSWGMPKFIAPLTLMEHVPQDDHSPRSIDTLELVSAINEGENIVLYGSGGLGKTTLLLDLCTSCLDAGVRIPLYVEAAVWARTNPNLFDYLATLPQARTSGVTSTEISGLAESGQLVLMLNGWNEISGSYKLLCREALIHLVAASQAISFVVASRSASEVPIPQKARYIEIQGLTWRGQSGVVGSELGDDKGAALLELLAKDMQLRHAGRNPLILKGMIEQAKKGTAASSSTFDLIAASIEAFEEDQQHNLILSAEPIYDQHRAYLEELACLLTDHHATDCPIKDALPAINRAASKLAQEQLLGHIPQPRTVLDVLANHHLLHLEDGVVRFAHQRFQEYFTANVLLRECLEDDVQPRFLLTALNLPAWYESLSLAAGKLKGNVEQAQARIKMVKAAAEIDVGLACDLAGICSFSKDDAPELYGRIVAQVNDLTASPFEEIRNLGNTLKITSRFQVFAKDLWSLLESENQQDRLQTYRLNGLGISFNQLGVDADKRIARWPSERRAEFVFEIANNAENYEYVVNLARCEPDHAVRAAAISALFWEFPASHIAIESWLKAPIEVQTDDRVLSCIQYALENGYATEEVTSFLNAIDLNDKADKIKLKWALTFPKEIGPHALDVIFEQLRNSKWSEDAAPLIAIARTNAPKRLFELARELALHERIEPQWVGEFLYEVPANIKTDIFEEALAVLQGQNFENLHGSTIGPLADRDQTDRGVALFLQAETGRITLPQVERDRQNKLGEILEHAPEKYLMSVVMERGLTATYHESIKLLDLLWRRIGREDRIEGTIYRWLPTTEEVREIVEVFAPKVETEEIPQDTVRVHLCSIAGAVDPDGFWPFLLETCRRHLDAWSIYREKKNQALRKARPYQLQNPYYGLYLISAIEKRGPKAIPDLLDMMNHPSAMDFIPEAIARVAIQPWVSDRKRYFFSLDDDIQEGEKRRKLDRQFEQPDSAYQRWTDDAANVLSRRLNELVKTYEDRRSANKEWNPREAEYQVGRLAGILARIPSTDIAESVSLALASGLMNIYDTVRVVRALIQQGFNIFNASVVRQIESLYDRVASEKWHDDSLRYSMSELSELLFRVEPDSLLSKPKDHYLKLWRKFAHQSEIIRRLGKIQSEAAWSGLLEIGKELAKNGQDTVTFIHSLFSILTPPFLTDFFELVADGTLFSWCRDGWTLKQLTSSLANVLSKTPDQVEVFIEACWKAKHPLADVLVGETLIHIKEFESVRQSYLLKALDAGRATDPGKPTYRMLIDLFTARVPHGVSTYEIVPIANNKVRLEIYERAKDKGPIAEGCKNLLASIESMRREGSRPDDERRHPASGEEIAWTDVLLSH